MYNKLSMVGLWGCGFGVLTSSTPSCCYCGYVGYGGCGLYGWGCDILWWVWLVGVWHVVDGAGYGGCGLCMDEGVA